jgi:hypothetical protein
MITNGQLKFGIGYSLSLGLMLLLAAGFDYLIKNTTAPCTIPFIGEYFRICSL